MTKKIAVMLTLLLVPLGCQEKGLRLNIRYARVYGLKAKDAVMAEGRAVGEVTAVSREKDGHYLVHVTIKKEDSNIATEHSRFYLVRDNGISGRRGIEIVQEGEAGAPLKDGDNITGSTRPEKPLGPLWSGLEKGLENLSRQLKQFSEGLKDIPKSEEYRKLKEELERLSEEIKRAEKAAREKVEKDLLPRLRKEMEKLKNRLRELRREKKPAAPGVKI